MVKTRENKDVGGQGQKDVSALAKKNQRVITSNPLKNVPVSAQRKSPLCPGDRPRHPTGATPGRP